MEKDEKKTQLAWMVPMSLQRIHNSGPKGQYLVRTSVAVKGMVKVHKRMSDMAKVVMKMFRGVSKT